MSRIKDVKKWKKFAQDIQGLPQEEYAQTQKVLDNLERKFDVSVDEDKDHPGLLTGGFFN